MNMIDLVGYLAASLVFLAFFMKGIAPLRLIALGSNFCFICYAVSLHLIPIVVLHLALIPVNCWRLREHLQDQINDRSRKFAPAGSQPRS